MTTTSPTVSNPLVGLQQLGQSVWLDYIRRSLITSGELRRLIDEDGLRGVTSNPAIFEKAIAGSTDYTGVLDALGLQNQDPKHLYEQIAIADVQAAADLLAPVYAASRHRDGYVSLEVSPVLADDLEGTLKEARRLWAAVARPNLMIKVPATAEGIVAVRHLIANGINVNVTLLFSQAIYQHVAEAYLAGLEDRAVRGEAIDGIASVASFFVSRIDSAVEAIAAANPAVRPLIGRVAIANAKLAYERYRALIEGKRWSALAAQGAQTQRLLWASTSSKNPSFRDVLYVEELIGEDTVNTIPPATFNAFRDHGRLNATLTADLEAARMTMQELDRAGVSIDDITDRLLDDGIEQFVSAFDRLLAATATRVSGRTSAKVNQQTYSLAADDAAAVKASLAEWQTTNKVRRLWDGDATLWTSADEAKWLGWLSITNEQFAHLGALTQLATEVRAAGFTHAVLLGMGGSSLCPEVLRLTFGTLAGYPELHILDSTDPAQVRAIERRIDLARTIFIVSSKSGGTLEPNIFTQYFFDRVKATVNDAAGSRFIAVTDPGSSMQKVAEQQGFRQVFFGAPSIGGRYSALSAFGMVPAAIMGLDLSRFLNAAEEMVHACAATVPAAENPGVVLGTILGVLANRGRDKVTLVTSPAIGDLGAWLEQLLAESTGKNGKGLIPIDGEPLGAPEAYGKDRMFVYLRLATSADAAQDQAIDRLERAGQPVVRIAVDDPYQIAEEFFRWEIATAVAGSIMGIHPFNQPDVEASKVATRKLTTEYERTGALPPDDAQTVNIADASLIDRLRSHLHQLGDGDYFALLAYVEMTEAHASVLCRIRQRVRDWRHVATCVGFGPRFLHSTGQAYKGGPNSGVFLQITCDDAADLQVPGQKYTFGIVKAAQARGDFEVLAERGRRALRLHLGSDVGAGLQALARAIDAVSG
jgi:transaldolase / glucose-6-phosphate isomerase